MNGDILTNLNFSQFIEEHLSNSSLFTISSHTRSEKIDYGVLNKDAEGRLIGFDEKPRKSYEVSMGIYAANISILNYISKQPYGFDNLMLDLLAANKPVHVRPFSGYWLDIGRPDDYLKAIEEFDTLRSKFLND
jgi:NDP-sugar pyrophosphorylase family protein